MTQTNNEREALIEDAKKAGFIHDECMGLMLPICLGLRMESLLSNFSKIVQDRAQSPISQNEQQESVTNLWEALGKWSAYLASNGEQANLAPPSWLIDAVKNATSPPKQAIPDGWKSLSERQIEDIALSNKFWFGTNNDRFDWHGFSVELSLKLQELNAAPTNTEVENE